MDSCPPVKFTFYYQKWKTNYSLSHLWTTSSLSRIQCESGCLFLQKVCSYPRLWTPVDLSWLRDPCRQKLHTLNTYCDCIVLWLISTLVSSYICGINPPHCATIVRPDLTCSARWWQEPQTCCCNLLIFSHSFTTVARVATGSLVSSRWQRTDLYIWLHSQREISLPPRDLWRIVHGELACSQSPQVRRSQ